MTTCSCHPEKPKPKPATMFIVCSFDSTSDIKGLNGRRRLHGAAADRIYDVLKATVIKAGKFSIFEATASQRAAYLFERLCKDPDLEIVNQGYPWTGVKLREATP